MEQNRTPITKAFFIRKGFEKFANFLQGNFRLEIKLPYPGERYLMSGELPHNRWICYYEVNKIAAAKTCYTEEEAEQLYLVLTGKELKDIKPD